MNPAKPRSALLMANDVLGVQVAAVGNHDFDLGEAFYVDVIKKAAFPYIASTLIVDDSPLAALVLEDTRWLAAADSRGHLLRRARACLGTIVDNHCSGGVVGVVGASPERLTVLSAGATHVRAPGDVTATVRALQTQVDALRAEGISVIVLLSHRQGVSNDIALLEAGLVGVDVIVSGGGENRLADPGDRLLPDTRVDEVCARETNGCYPLWRTAQDGAPVAFVATDGGMTTVGALDIAFDDAGVSTGASAASRPWLVDEASLLELRGSVDKDVLGLELATRDALGPLSRVVGDVGVFLDGTRETVRSGETNLGDLSADAMVRVARTVDATVVAALRNGGGIRGSIGAVAADGTRHSKPVTMLDLASAFRFDSPIVVVDVSHAELAQAMNNALKAADSSGSFPQVSGDVQLHISPLGTVDALRVGDRLVVDAGVVQQPNARVRIATIDYLANGGDGWFTAKIPSTPVPSTEQQSFVQLLADPDAVQRSLSTTNRIKRL
jgi:2',3'-cyclic-nucleotide 2'-phosphodiesterase (5'-nucleotidase family)